MKNLLVFAVCAVAHAVLRQLFASALGAYEISLPHCCRGEPLWLPWAVTAGGYLFDFPLPHYPILSDVLWGGLGLRIFLWTEKRRNGRRIPAKETGEVGGEIWPPPPQRPQGADWAPVAKRITGKSLVSWFGVLAASGASVEFWRLEWFDGDAGRIDIAYDFFLPYAIGLCIAPMLWGSYVGYRSRYQLAGKLAMALPMSSAVMFLPYILYFYRWKDLAWWPW